MPVNTNYILEYKHQYFHTLLFRTCATAKSAKKVQKDGKAASKKTQVSNLKKRGQEIFLEKVLY